MARGRPKALVIERLNKLFPQRDWSAYPHDPEFLCWAWGQPDPKFHTDTGARHPVAAFFIALGARPGNFRISKMCRGCDSCVNPYHFTYRPKPFTPIPDALEYAISMPMPADPFDGCRTGTLADFIEANLILYPASYLEALYLNRPLRRSPSMDSSSPNI
jgi:hypothetical protein